MNNEDLAYNLLRLRTVHEKTQEEIAVKAKISIMTYRNIESGKSNPTTSTIKSLADCFSITINELLKPAKKLKHVRFRALQKKNIKKREQILYLVSDWLDEYNYLEQKTGDKTEYKLSKLQCDSEVKNIEQLAQKARARLEIGNEPVRDICGLLESRAGIKIYAREFKSDAFFGLSILEDDGSKVIVVNTWDRIPIERRIFSVAHEFGHILMHLTSFDKPNLEEDTIEEKEANTFASYFLMPEKDFIDEWNKGVSFDFIDRVIKVKQIFKVSHKAVLYRLSEILESKNININIWQKFNFEYKKKYPNSKLSYKEELNPLNSLNSLDENSIELGALSDNFYFGGKLAKLVKEAIKKKIISTKKGAEVLNIDTAKMNELAKSWDDDLAQL
ncbi:MAG: XRE family transcriptional regulator [Candidatus Gastranaerophilales bacterium]|nr:XRE family transcriptional regulator [Candidatus Gastranaerophilales bacterium]